MFTYYVLVGSLQAIYSEPWMRNIIAPSSSKWIEAKTLGKVCKNPGRAADRNGVQQLHKTLPSAKLSRKGIERNDSTRRTVDNDSARRQTRKSEYYRALTS